MSVAERYRIRGRLGAGGLGVVELVDDQATGRVLAMKVMPRTTGIGNLRGEFLALARLRHDNIVSVYDYGLTDAGQDYFTMDYVEGPPLLEAVGSIGSPRFYQLIGGILRALAFVHSRGMVHADIKPSNILVDAEVLATDPSRAVRLADFGLAAATNDPGSSTARGTFPYAAPEVYAGRLDARSDLYALGVVLYEVCCQRQPFTGQTAGDVLHAQRTTIPASPSASADVPEPLSELILALLDPAPGARPQTADEVLARINEIAGTDFDIAESVPLVDMSTVFVGRERDVEAVSAMWQSARNGAGGVVLIVGEEGIGKTRLLEEIELQVKLGGGRVHSGAMAPAGDRPFAGIAELVRWLLAGLGPAVRNRRPELRPVLAPLFGAPAVGPPRIDPSARYALAEAVTGLVLELAESNPLLLVVDDLHLADDATAELIAYLARSVADAPVLLVVAGRADEHPAAETPVTRLDQAVRAVSRGLRLDLPPMDRHNLGRMIELAFGEDLAAQLARDLHRACGGNPAHAAFGLEQLVANGVIARERGAWVLWEQSPEIPLAPDAVTSALTRADKLATSTLGILEIASVLGDEIARDDLVAIAACVDGTGEASVAAAVAELGASRLVEADAAAGAFHLAHAGVAEAIASRVEPARADAIHRAASERLLAARAANRPVSNAGLARHLLAIGDTENAIEAGLSAADERAAAYDHPGAIAWCERVRPLIGDPRRAAEIDERLGQLRSLLGDVTGACRDYQRAHQANAGSPADHVRIALELGELSRRIGEGDEALRILMIAMDEARSAHLTEAEARCQLRIGWVLMYRAEYKAAAEHAVAGHLVARASGHLAAAAELGRLRGTIDIYRGDTRSTLELLQVARADAETAGDDTTLAGILHAMGHAAIRVGDYERAIDALEKAIATTQRAGLIEQTAKSLNNLGAAYYFQGNWQQARTTWERFRRLCERLDERTELVRALSNLGSLYRDQGHFSQAREALARAARVAELTGHAHTAAMVTANLGEVLFREGDAAAAREHYRRALQEFERIEAREDIIETRRRMCELDISVGKLSEAIERSVDAARQAKEAGVKLEEGALHRVAASALRLQGDRESSEWFVGRAREILTGIGSRYELAKLELEAAEVAAAAGRTREAQSHLDIATATFTELGARWDLNQARARARAWAARTPHPIGPGAVVGHDLLLQLIHALGNLELEELLVVALDKLLEVTRFERGFLLLLDEEGRPSERLRRERQGSRGFDKSEAEFSGTIVRRTAASGEATSVSDIAEDADLRDQRSVVALGLRQIMCAPMRSRGRVIGVLYIDSQRLAFDGHGIDLTFLEAFAAQLSLAIENARLVAEERRQSELLAILAHEIRNPLAGIIGYADIGEADDLGPEATEIFGHIRTDADRLRRLVDNVLELARHESGNVDWSMISLDVRELIDEVARGYGPQCELKRIGLTIDYEGLTPRALGNPDRLMQVLSNLLGNAVKFTPEGGSITVRAYPEAVAANDPEAPPIPAHDIDAWTPLEPSDDRRQFVRIDVIDTGPGMTEEVRQRLFRKFSQGGTRQRTRGVGLGLYISRNIVLRHGGSIFVASAPGQGSTFSARIPVSPG